MKPLHLQISGHPAGRVWMAPFDFASLSLS